MVLDTGKPEGRAALIAILKDADVFITNVRPGALKRARLDYDSLKAELPRLIYANVTGYGLTGPDADTPAFDLTGFWNRSGVAARDQSARPRADRLAPGHGRPCDGAGDAVRRAGRRARARAGPARPPGGDGADAGRRLCAGLGHVDPAAQRRGPDRPAAHTRGRAPSPAISAPRTSAGSTSPSAAPTTSRR